MLANTCRHRGHELLPTGEASQRRNISCPYHAWTYDLAGRLKAAPGFREVESFDRADHGLVELPVTVWEGWVFGHALTSVHDPLAPSFERHLGELERVLAPYDIGSLVVADRHTYEVAANWKVISENYHECYHCPLIHPQLCQVSPPDSGVNYDLPGAWIGGCMDLRDGVATMSMSGELAATPLPGAPRDTVEYLHLLPNLLVSAHPDYVMTHRMLPLTPGRTWVECSWLTLPEDAPGGAPARGGVLGHHQPSGLGGVRVGAARPAEPALPARAVRPQRGRGGAAGRDHRGGVPHRARCRVNAQLRSRSWSTRCRPATTRSGRCPSRDVEGLSTPRRASAQS